MTPKVEFHFDFGSPNCYFAHKVISDIEQRTGAKVTYVPILLGGVFKLTNNQPPMVQFKDVKSKRDYQLMEAKRFIKKHRLTQFKMNLHFPVNTVQVMRASVAAEMDGQLGKFADAVFRHMWEEGLKMDDPEVIRTALDAADLDGARILGRIQEHDVKDKLRTNTEASVARGTFGAPTFFVGDEMFFGKDKLHDVEEEIAVAKARA